MPPSTSTTLRYFKEHHSFHLNADWLKQCLEFVESFGSSDLNDFIYQQVLLSDLRSSMEGQVNLTNKGTEVLKGRHILQVDEFVNISENYERQFQEHDNRMLKFCMTDGSKALFGIEYQPIPILSIHSLPGIKILVKDVMVRHGLLLLSASNTVVLGGQVATLVELEQKKRTAWEHSQKGFLEESKSDEPSPNYNTHTHYSPGPSTKKPNHEHNTTTNNNVHVPPNFLQPATTTHVQKTKNDHEFSSGTKIKANAKGKRFEYLADLIRDGPTGGEYVILAGITKVVSPLRCGKGKYELAVVVDDGTMSVPAILHDTFVCELMEGITADRFMKLGKEDSDFVGRSDLMMKETLSATVALLRVTFQIDSSGIHRVVVLSKIPDSRDTLFAMLAIKN